MHPEATAVERKGKLSPSVIDSYCPDGSGRGNDDGKFIMHRRLQGFLEGASWPLPLSHRGLLVRLGA